MNRNKGYSFGITYLIRRALEGRISSLGFLVVLGFFSSLVLLYLALHVHFIGISRDINEISERVKILKERNVCLKAEYNDLISPERIIPIVQGFGMRPGSPDEMRRFAVYQDYRIGESEAAGLAQVNPLDDSGASLQTLPEIR